MTWIVLTWIVRLGSASRADAEAVSDALVDFTWPQKARYGAIAPELCRLGATRPLAFTSPPAQRARGGGGGGGGGQGRGQARQRTATAIRRGMGRAVGGCASDQELFHAQARDYEGLIAEDRAEVQRLEKQLAERLARRRLGEPSAAVAALAQP